MLIKRLFKYIARQPSRLGLFFYKIRYGLPTIKLENIIEQRAEIHEPILDDICLPPYQGPKDVNDYDALMQIAVNMMPNVVVELGTAFGNTTANLCRHAPSARMYTVNAPLELQTGKMVTYSLTENEIGRVYKNHKYQDRVVQIYENTLYLDLKKHLSGHSVDLAIIDACHDTEYVVNDFLKIAPHVASKGIVLFHDTHPSMAGHLGGSYKACMQLRQKGYDVRHIEGTWWAIWVNSQA